MRKQVLVFGAILVMAPPAATAEDWHLHGGTQTDRRFSPLNQINERTVSRLGLAWSMELGTSRGLEATPIVEDGVIYTTGAWNMVFAFDARTGQMKWTTIRRFPASEPIFSVAMWSTAA